MKPIRPDDLPNALAEAEESCVRLARHLADYGDKPGATLAHRAAGLLYAIQFLRTLDVAA